MTSVVDQRGCSLPGRLLWSALLLLLLCACARSPQPRQISGQTMGTSYHITWLAGPGGVAVEEIREGVEARLEIINRSMSTYREDSEISRFNRAPPDSPILLSSDFIEVFDIARKVAQASGGSYDVTVAPLVDLWGFGPAPRRDIPDQAVREAALAQVGESALELNREAQTLIKRAPRQLDFSSVAKGYAVDRIAEFLLARGIGDFLVEIGGEIRVAGNSPQGKPWRIAIERPNPALREAMATLEISDVAVATSGDYRNFFELDGVRYSHNIDPRTGHPVKHELVSVTVLHASAAVADAWATALLVAGRAEALRLATEQQLAVYLVSRDGEQQRVEKTPTIEAWLR